MKRVSLLLITAILLGTAMFRSSTEASATENQSIGSVLFEDNFDNGSLAQWTVLAGSWTAATGSLETSISPTFTRSDIQAGSASWVNYRLDLDTWYVSGSDEEIRVRVDSSSSYAIGLHHNLVMGDMDVRFGTSSQGWIKFVPAQLRPNTRQHVTIDVLGSQVTVFLNGQEIINYVDNNNIAPSGAIRLSAWSGANGNEHGFFDNVRVVALTTTITPPYDSCATLASHSPSPPQGSPKVLSEGFSVAVATCDASTGTLQSRSYAFGGTHGGVDIFTSNNAPNQEAVAEVAQVVEFVPQFTGVLRVDANLIINGKEGSAAGSGLAASMNVGDEIGGTIIDWLFERHIAALGHILNSLLEPTAALADTDVFLQVSGSGTSGEATSHLTSAVATFPAPGPYSQSVLYNNQHVRLSTVVQVTQGQAISVRVWTKSHARSWGWAASFGNLAVPGTNSQVESIVLTTQR